MVQTAKWYTAKQWTLEWFATKCRKTAQRMQQFLQKLLSWSFPLDIPSYFPQRFFYQNVHLGFLQKFFQNLIIILSEDSDRKSSSDSTEDSFDFCSSEDFTRILLNISQFIPLGIPPEQNNDYVSNSTEIPTSIFPRFYQEFLQGFHQKVIINS